MTSSPAAKPRFIKPLLWFTALAFLQKSSFLILLPLYLNVLEPASLGALGLITVTAGILAVVANLGLDAAMRTFYFDYADDEARLQRYLAQLFSASLFLIAAFFVILLLIGPPLFDRLFDHDELVFYPYGVLAFAAVCINLALSPYLIYLRNRQLLTEFAVLQLIAIIGNVGAQLVFVGLLGWGVAGALSGSLLAAILTLGYVLVTQPRLISARLDPHVLKPSLRFSLPLVAFSFLYLLESRLDRYFIEQYFSMDVVGAYVVLITLLGALGFFLNTLDNAIRPLLFTNLQQATAAKNDLEDLQRLYVLLSLLVLSVVVLLGSSLGLVAAEPLYLGIRDWFPLGATALLPMIYARYCAMHYVFHKRSAALTFWALARTLLMLALLWALVPTFGIGGALLSLLISQMVNAVTLHIQLHRFEGAGISPTSSAVQCGIFAACLWLPTLFLPDNAYGVYGMTQLIFATCVLLAMSRESLQRLFARPDAA